MTEFGTLQERGRKLYVVHESPRYDEPILLRLWYPLDFTIVHGMMDVWRPLIGQKLHGTATPGAYVGEKDGCRYCLPQGGQTKPEFSEEEAIPPPKRCKRTRYQYGHWEKYTKAHGWQRV